MYMTIQQLGHKYHVLDFTDISSSLGWINKASFDPVKVGGHYTVAQWMVWKLDSNEGYIYSQNIKGTENIIVDSLSRGFNISDQSLTKKFISIIPPQTTASFHIKLPPREIISWVFSLDILAHGLGTMMHIPHTHRHHGKIHGRNPKKRKDNSGVVVCSISEKKPV